MKMSHIMKRISVAANERARLPFTQDVKDKEAGKRIVSWPSSKPFPRALRVLCSAE